MAPRSSLYELAVCLVLIPAYAALATFLVAPTIGLECYDEEHLQAELNFEIGATIDGKSTADW